VVSAFAGSAAPTGYLLCEGQEISKTTYAALYAAIGDTYAAQYNEITGTNWAAPGAGNFRVPDYRGSFLRGLGTPSGLDAVTLGGRQAQKTAKNGLSNASSAVSGTTNIGHSHGASSVTGTIDIAHTHAASSVSGSVGGSDGTHAHNINYANATGSNYSCATGSTQASIAGIVNSTGSGHGHGFSLSAAGHTLGTTNVSLASGSAAGQTLATTNVSLASGSAAGQVISGDNETRPINKGVNWIIKAV
jgi:microcystin-dependent protein